MDDLKKYKKFEVEKTRKFGKEGIDFWKNRIKEYQSLSKKEAVDKLIKAEKIEQKITTIQKAINKTFALLTETT